MIFVIPNREIVSLRSCVRAGRRREDLVLGAVGTIIRGCGFGGPWERREGGMAGARVWLVCSCSVFVIPFHGDLRSTE